MRIFPSCIIKYGGLFPLCSDITLGLNQREPWQPAERVTLSTVFVDDLIFKTVNYPYLSGFTSFKIGLVLECYVPCCQKRHLICVCVCVSERFRLWGVTTPASRWRPSIVLSVTLRAGGRHLLTSGVLFLSSPRHDDAQVLSWKPGLSASPCMCGCVSVCVSACVNIQLPLWPKLLISTSGATHGSHGSHTHTKTHTHTHACLCALLYSSLPCLTAHQICLLQLKIAFLRRRRFIYFPKLRATVLSWRGWGRVWNRGRMRSNFIYKDSVCASVSMLSNSGYSSCPRDIKASCATGEA